MDDAQSRQNARLQEIQAKKARLAELKRNRELKDQEIRRARLSAVDKPEIIQPSPSRAERAQELKSLLDSIESHTGSPRRQSRPTSTTSSRPLSGQRLSSGSGEPIPSDIVSATSAPSGGVTIYASTSTQTLTASPMITVYDASSQPEPQPKKVETIVYDKGIQTESWSSPKSKGTGVQWAVEEGDAANEDKEKELERIREELRKEIEEELRSTLEDTKIESVSDKRIPERFPLRTLTDEELEAVVDSQDFKEFVDQSSKIIDRALDEQYDLLIDYAQGSGNFDDDEDAYSKGRSRRGKRVKQVSQFWHERWSKKRMISDVAFSPKYPELLLASYTKNPAAPHEPYGLVQVWNSHMPSRPEYIFHNSSSDILSAKFSPFHPKLVVGGCYSGQVLVWDMRTTSPNPVQKTPLTGLGHTHPIYSLDIVGTQNANNIISCSTDGVVCTWAIDMLAQPQEKLQLHAPAPAKSEDVAPQCIAFPPADPTYFLAGTEEGTIFACHRYERAGAKAGIDSRVSYAGHAAPVMAVDFHPARGPVDLGDLVLSASMDWTVKLWRVRPPATLGSAVTGNTAIQGAVIDIPREDIVYDVKWSPVRPGIFALVDGAGALEIWDINSDIEIPVAKATPTQEFGNAWPKCSLNRVAWERNEGKRVAVGGLDGVVTVFEVGSELGGAEGAKPEEWSGVKKVVSRAEAQAGARAVVNGNGK